MILRTPIENVTAQTYAIINIEEMRIYTSEIAVSNMSFDFKALRHNVIWGRPGRLV
jgi:hypothetical protein